MIQVPELSRAAVKSELEAIHGRRHRAYHTAFLGRANEDLAADRVVEAEVLGVKRRFRVAEVGCELALRKELASTDGDPLALLIAYPCERLPHDLAARVAGGGVQTIDRRRRLAALFKAQRVASEVLVQGHLVAALLEGSGYPAVAGTTLDLRTAWTALLARLGVKSEDLASEVALLARATTNAEGPALAGHLKRYVGLAPALSAWLRESVGPVGAIAFEAWLADEGRRVAALAVVLEACAQAVPQNDYLRGRLKGLFEKLAPHHGGLVQDGALLSRWASLAAPLLLKLGPVEAELLLAEAGRLLPDAEVADLLARSRNLPVGWEAARKELASAFDEAARTPGRSAALSVKAGFERLRGHRFADVEQHYEDVERARSAVRLALWLAWRREGSVLPPVGAPDHEVVVGTSCWYVKEGAHVDAARRACRGGGGDVLAESVKRLLATADAARDEEDGRFAAALPRWERRAGNAIPIEAALDRIAVPYLTGGAARRIVVVLLDGMSWAVALELLDDLGRNGVGPLCGQPWLDSRNLHPVLAALPTLTEVSRAAFFAGKRPRAGDALSTGGDRDRFANHRGLGAFGVPRLLLASDAVDPEGGLTKTAREMIGGDERVVGLVVNAVDDQLRGGPQLRPRYRVDDIRPMRDAIQEAQQAGRALLLAADHGHVPGARLRYVAPGGEGGGARWRPLVTGEEPGPKEVAVGGEVAWRRRGVDRVALLWAEDACFSAGTREGEHGGAALAEVVTPAILVGSASLARTMEQEGDGGPAFEVRSLPRPRWWDLEVPPAPVQAAPLPVASVRAKAKIPDTQATLPLPLPEPEPPPPAVPPPAAGGATALPDRHAWLGKSKVLDTMLAAHPRVKKEMVLLAVRTLAEQEGRLAPDVFANRIGELPRRVAGVISHLQEVLNVEGYQVLRLERGAGGRVELDLTRLEELFKEER